MNHPPDLVVWNDNQVILLVDPVDQGFKWAHWGWLVSVAECLWPQLGRLRWLGPRTIWWSRKWHPTPVLLPENPMDGGAWSTIVHGVAKSQTRLSDFTFTFHFHALEKEMATHSRILSWRIPGTEEPSGLPSMGSHRVRHNWSNLAATAGELSGDFFTRVSGTWAEMIQSLGSAGIVS